jgi:DNA-binding response OmpR family regulator
MRILLFEHHKRLTDQIVDGLFEFGFGVDAFTNEADGLAAMRALNYDAIVLSLELPDREDIEVLGALRRSDGVTPLLVLSARDAVDDRVAALDRGADDYLVKPFAMQELAARLRALLRRPGRVLSTVLNLSNVSFETSARQLTVNGKIIGISRHETAALELMMRCAGKVVSKRSLESVLYGLTTATGTNAVEAVVSRLRKRLKAAGGGCVIHTLRGVGYLLNDE